MIPDGAHHLDLRYANDLDPPSVREARKLELSYFGKWIRQAAKKHQRVAKSGWDPPKWDVSVFAPNAFDCSIFTHLNKSFYKSPPPLPPKNLNHSGCGWAAVSLRTPTVWQQMLFLSPQPESILHMRRNEMQPSNAWKGRAGHSKWSRFSICKSWSMWIKRKRKDLRQKKCFIHQFLLPFFFFFCKATTSPSLPLIVWYSLILLIWLARESS